MTTILSTKGQIVIPAEVRERKGFHPGDELDVRETADGIMIRKKYRNEGLAAHLLKLKGTGLKVASRRKEYSRTIKF